MTNFEKITASPEALGEFLAALNVAGAPWEEDFHRTFCDSCGAENCDAECCPHSEARENPLRWLRKEVNVEKRDKPAVAKDINVPSKPAKPRLAEVLGVEEDEKWRYPECAGLYCVHNGVREYWDENNGWLPCDCEEDLIKIIAHPESIIRAQRLTEVELERCRVYGAKWVSMDNVGIHADLWEEEPIRNEKIFVQSPESRGAIASVRSCLFPSVGPGDCICVEVAGE